MAHPRRPIASPQPDVSDIDAYMDLFRRVVEAPSPAALIALMGEIVTFEGGRFEDDFKREWLFAWQHHGGTIRDMPPWPPGGPFSRHAVP
jgi:hypothetical protein